MKIFPGTKRQETAAHFTLPAMKFFLPFQAGILAAFLLMAIPVASSDESRPAPSIEQRLSAMEAYFSNTDPSASLKNSDGTIPAGLTTPAVGVPGPGHTIPG